MLWAWMLWSQSLNTNGIMRWAWMLWSPYALGTRRELCVGHGCSGHRMLFNTNGKPTNVSLKKRAFRWTEKSPDGCYCYTAILLYCYYTTTTTTTTTSMLLEHERNYALGMDALVTVFEHERNYALGMDALVTVCSWNTKGIMRWAWMLWSPYALQHERKANKCKPEKTCVSLDGKVTRWLLLLYCYTAILLYCYTAILLYCYYTTTTTATTTTTRRIRAQPVRVGL